MEKTASRLEKLFLLFLFVNPFLDLLSGIYIYYAESLGLPGFTPSLLVRLCVLALYALYVLLVRDKYAIGVVLACLAAWVLSLAGQCFYFYSFDLSEDVTYIVKFVYNLATLLVYYRILVRRRMDEGAVVSLFRRAFCFTPFVFSLSIVLCYILGLGYRTYGDRFGYFGSRGFFYSGNDITAVLMMLLFMTLLFLFTLKKGEVSKWRFAYIIASPALTVVALLLIGTKTAFIAVGGAFIVSGVYVLVALFSKKGPSALWRFLLLLVAVALVFSLLVFFRGSDVSSGILDSIGHISDVYQENGDLTNTIFSGRQYKLKKAFSMWREEPFFIVFGTGRGSHARIIEMDIFEVLFYYGVFGFIVLLGMYVLSAFRVLRGFFKKPDVKAFFILGALGVCAGYFLIAGHVLFSVTSGFYFSLVLLYAYLHYTPPETSLYLNKKTEA